MCSQPAICLHLMQPYYSRNLFDLRHQSEVDLLRLYINAASVLLGSQYFMCWKFYGRLCPLSHCTRATKIQVFIRLDTSVQSFPFKDNHNGSLFGSVSINFNSCRSLRNYMKPSKCDHCAASVSASASQFFFVPLKAQWSLFTTSK